jgi:DNA-binding CsgD family transcriptional regulator
VDLPELSITEQRIARLAATGKTEQEIAQVLVLDEPTVRWHLARAVRKLQQAASLHERLSAQRRPLGPR